MWVWWAGGGRGGGRGPDVVEESVDGVGGDLGFGVERLVVRGTGDTAGHVEPAGLYNNGIGGRWPAGGSVRSPGRQLTSMSAYCTLGGGRRARPACSRAQLTSDRTSMKSWGGHYGKRAGLTVSRRHTDRVINRLIDWLPHVFRTFWPRPSSGQGRAGQSCGGLGARGEGGRRFRPKSGRARAREREPHSPVLWSGAVMLRFLSSKTREVGIALSS